MPPRIKKKKTNALPPLSFVTSPTPSTIKFPNVGSSQSQPLEVPIVPYAQGGKWLAMQFAQSDTKNIKLPCRRRRKSKSDVNGIAQTSRKRAVVSGCEPRHNSSRNHSSTTYMPLEVTVSGKATVKKRHSRHGREGKSDDVADASSHTSADETMRTVSLVKNDIVCIQPNHVDVVPPFAFSVKTPIFESGSLEDVNPDETLRLRSHNFLNVEDSCHNDIRMDNLNGDNNSTSSKCKGRCTLRLFQSSSGEDCDLQEAEVLAPDTPEHERGQTFYQRRLKKRH